MVSLTDSELRALQPDIDDMSIPGLPHTECQTVATGWAEKPTIGPFVDHFVSRLRLGGIMSQKNQTRITHSGKFEEEVGMKPGQVRAYRGQRALVASFGIWASRGRGGWHNIHMTGDNRNFKHITVTDNPRSSTMYNRALYRDLKQLLVAYDKWPFSDETVEKEEVSLGIQGRLPES
jgi:hypothetical protein